MGIYFKGSGVSADPYIVHNQEALKEMLTVDFCGGKYFSVVADIDCEGAEFSYYSPISGGGATHKTATADFTVDLNGYRCTNFIMKNNNTTWSSLGIYFNTDFSIKNGVFEFKTTASYVGTNWQNYSLIDVRLSAGKSFPLTNSGRCERCFFPIPFQGLSNALGCYSIGFISGCTNTEAKPFNQDSYPILLGKRDIWVVDGVSYPITMKRNVDEIVNGYAIKGVTRVGNARKKRSITIMSAAYLSPIWKGNSNEDGTYLAKLYDYYDAVIALHFDDYGYPLKKDTNYVLGDVIHPSSPNGYRYICEQAGTSGPILPAEPWSVEVLLTVGTAKFRPYPVYEPKCLGPIYPGKANLVTGEKV